MMTGIGDEARGSAELKEAGAVNLARDEAARVVAGMPAEAVERGGTNFVTLRHAMAAEVARCEGEPD